MQKNKTIYNFVDVVKEKKKGGEVFFRTEV